MFRKNRFRLALVLGLFLLLIVLGLTGPVNAAPDAHEWVGNKFDGNGHEAWDGVDNNYETGNIKGYAQGDTAAFRVSVDGTADNQQLKFLICLDLDVSANGFAFTTIESWDTTETPGTPPAISDLTGEVNGVNAANGTIDNVTFLGENVAHDGENCGDDYLGWLVEFTVTDASQLTYIVYGGHLADDGNSYITAPGGTPQIVPLGKGAYYVNGTFQARIVSTGTGNKTVNFNSNDIEDPLAITLQGVGAADVNRTVVYMAFGLAALLLVLTVLVRRGASSK